MTALDPELQRRAFALCLVAEPHRDADEDIPCDACLLQASRQLAIPASHLSALASTSATRGSAAPGAGVDGAAGRVPGAPPACGQDGGSTLQTHNHLGTRNPEVAEGGPVRPQNGR